MGDPSAFEGRRTFAEFLTESCGRRKDWRESQHIGTLLEVAGWNGIGPRPPVTVMPDGQLVIGVEIVPNLPTGDGRDLIEVGRVAVMSTSTAAGLTYAQAQGYWQAQCGGEPMVGALLLIGGRWVQAGPLLGGIRILSTLCEVCFQWAEEVDEGGLCVTCQDVNDG